MAADLHCHTKLSDGSVGIEELIALAKAAGMSAVAVTDHDTMAGATRAKMLGERSGITVLPGAEFSCRDTSTGRNVHLLCYLPDVPDRLQGLCKSIGQRRKEAGLKMAALVINRFHLPKSLIQKWITGSTNLYKQHIMLALRDAGYTTELFGQLYQELFGVNGWAKVPIEYPDVREVLLHIHEAGGLAVMAHPFFYDSVALIPTLADLGLDGIEVWHYSAKEEQRRQLLEMAKEYDLCVTGGSDFHGANSAFVNPVGSHTVEDDCVDALLAAKRRQVKKTAASGV